MVKSYWIGLALTALFALPALAQAPRLEIWDIALGTPVAEIPAGFVDYACGTNGGPPSRKLAGFADFATCRAEKSGLHEVYFRYDDEQEYIARALEQQRDVVRFGGTVAYDFPVLVSLLIDDSGMVQGKRILSDARPAFKTNRARYEFWTLGNLLRNQFTGDWACAQLEPAAGEEPVGTFLIKSDCTLVGDDGRVRIEQRYLHKRGQTFVDPLTKRYQPDAFESTTRFEQVAAGFGG
ncbi:MAG TPA: hypothetical protein VL133_10460 [Devosia sp.]|nr:hypothetical protein [Devosia sp.]